MVEEVGDIEDDDTERIKAVLESCNALTEPQEEDSRRSRSDEDNTMLDDDTMRTGQSAIVIDVADAKKGEDGKDEEEA